MRRGWTITLLLLALSACATQGGQKVAAPAPAPAPCIQTGLASWYRPGAQPGKTADGEKPGPGTLLAAHRTLPFGTQVKVTALQTGQSVMVRIGDRGPFAKDRIIDLPAAAASQLGIKQDGVTEVKLEIDQTSSGTACPFDQGHAA